MKNLFDVIITAIKTVKEWILLVCRGAWLMMRGVWVVVDSEYHHQYINELVGAICMLIYGILTRSLRLWLHHPFLSFLKLSRFKINSISNLFEGFFFKDFDVIKGFQFSRLFTKQNTFCFFSSLFLFLLSFSEVENLVL